MSEHLDAGTLYRLHIRYLGPSSEGPSVGELLLGEVGYGLPLDGTGGPGDPADAQRSGELICMITARPPEDDAAVSIPETLGPNGVIQSLVRTVDLRPFLVEDGKKRRVGGSDPSWDAAVVACADVSAWFAVRWERVASS